MNYNLLIQEVSGKAIKESRPAKQGAQRGPKPSLLILCVKSGKVVMTNLSLLTAFRGHSVSQCEETIRVAAPAEVRFEVLG